MSFFDFLIGIAIAWLLWKLLLSGGSKSNGSTKIQGASQIPSPTLSVTTSNPEPRIGDEDKDAWEGSFWEVQTPLSVQARLRISYEDGNGKRTERTVDVRQFGNYGHGDLLIGHCHMRNATRTFRSDRIRGCVDEKTGEVISDVSAYVRDMYEKSPEHSRDRVLEEEYDALRILFYVGKADGQLRASEKSIILDTCRLLAKDSRLTDEMLVEIFNGLSVPTLQAFKLAVGRAAGKGLEERALLIKAAERMVATQKTVHSSEQEALLYMRKRLLDSSP